ncbi:MAG: dCMP deaminase [Patescibacteria group bacterium]|jgi:dCMP deaminase|nr:dCMP deaminase [Patescibacteria group bacterium]
MLVAFVPVLHKGYLELFKKYPEELGILGLDVIADYTSLTRDLRIIDPHELKQAIEGLQIFSRVRVLSKADLETLGASGIAIVMPDEDVSRDISSKYFGDRVTFASVHIRNRWDKKFVNEENTVAPQRVISKEAADIELMKLSNVEADKSADWWRQIGAVLVKEGKVVYKNWNKHLPSDFHLAYNGDPRSNFDRGQRPDVYTSVHAEAGIIARAAKEGVALEGTSIYTSTFPCPNCARLIGESGIKKVYYQKGYSLLDAEDILKVYEVEIVLVQNPERM